MSEGKYVRARATGFNYPEKNERTAISSKVFPTVCQSVFVDALHLIPVSVRDDCLPPDFRRHETFGGLNESPPGCRRWRSTIGDRSSDK